MTLHLVSGGPFTLRGDTLTSPDPFCATIDKRGNTSVMQFYNFSSFV